MYRTVAAATTRGGVPTDNVDSVVTLDQVPRWSDAEYRSSLEFVNEDPSFSNSYFPDPLTSSVEESGSNGMVSRFPVDHEINSKIYLWRGQPWNLEVDAVVNSTNEVSTKFSLPYLIRTNAKYFNESHELLILGYGQPCIFHTYTCMLHGQANMEMK